jgi:hypothetical protein
MTPADQATPRADVPFSIRRRDRGGRRITQVSASLNAMDALRARIRAQSQQVAVHIQAEPGARAFIDDWATPEPLAR